MDPLERLTTLGLRIASLRKARGMSQMALAKASGIDRTYLSGIENGRQNVTVGVLCKLSDGLGAELMLELRA